MRNLKSQWLVLLLLSFVWGCGNSTPSTMNTTTPIATSSSTPTSMATQIPNVEGEVTKIFRGRSASDTTSPISGLFVEGVEPPNAKYMAVSAQADVSLLPTTQILLQHGATASVVTAERLQLGQHVKVWTDGAIEASDPPSFNANKIVIVSD